MISPSVGMSLRNSTLSSSNTFTSSSIWNCESVGIASMTRFFSNVESESECSRRSIKFCSANVVRGCTINLLTRASLDVFGRGGGGGGTGGFELWSTISWVGSDISIIYNKNIIDESEKNTKDFYVRNFLLATNSVTSFQRVSEISAVFQTVSTSSSASSSSSILYILSALSISVTHV